MSARLEEDARFHDFVMFQAQNAGLFLGQLPNPTTGKKSLNLRAAESVMNCLEMLAIKTNGNLTAKEGELLNLALKNLRPLFDAAQSKEDS